MNESSVELTLLQNNFNANFYTHDSPIHKAQRNPDSPLSHSNVSRWQQQEIQTSTTSPTKMRGVDQKRLHQQFNILHSTNPSILGTRIVRNAPNIIDETRIKNGFFVNNRARERWSRKKTRQNLNGVS